MISRISTFLLATALTAGFATAPAEAGAARISAKGEGGGASIDFNWMSALKTAGTLDCDTHTDRDTQAMMRALEGRDARGRYEWRDGDERLTSVRTGERFTLEGRSEDGSFRVGLPWAVAQCLFGGQGAPRRVDLASLRKAGAVSFQWKGNKGGITAAISLD